MGNQTHRFRAVGILIAIFLPVSGAFAQLADTWHPFMDGDPLQIQLAAEVRHTLVTLPDYTVFDNVQFNMDGDTVMLYGEVTRPELKPALEFALKRIKGLELVNDQIQVLPVSPADDRIRRAVYRAIYQDPALARNGFGAVLPIHIVVENGKVMLYGLVATAAGDQMAVACARSVPDVAMVVDNLHVGASWPASPAPPGVS